MSGIFGIFNRNGKPVEEKTVNTMLDAMAYWDPDEQDTWSEGPVALGHTMLWNTPESKYEHFPLEKDAIVLTMDARIDNREELANMIVLPDRPMSEIGDSEFILAAYQKWGEECPKHLLGDFSFVIWDEQKQQLFCARDHVGVKQLYYHVSDDLFLCGNDLKGLTQYPNISQKINDEAVANYIVNHQLLSNTLTFFETFKKLPPAHTLTITHSTMEEKCYWRLEDAPKVKLPNAEAYAQKLRELLEEAVYARIRSDYPITSHLSGGLDSSSIAVIAARKLKEKDEKLLAFNWLHEPEEGDDLEHYEWANSRMIAEIEGIDHHYVTLTSEDIYENMNTYNIFYGNSIRFWYEYSVRNLVKEKKSRCILSGFGGDELASYHGKSYYFNLLVEKKWHRLFNELKIILKHKTIKQTLSILYFKFIVYMVPKRMYCKIPKIRCENYLSPVLKKSILSLVKTDKIKMIPQSTIRSNMLTYWSYGHLQSRIESWSVVSRSNGIEYNYPLLDKRIIEFILGVPSEYFINEGIGRFIFRSSIKGLLPENIIWSNAKVEQHRVNKLTKLTVQALKRFLSEEKIANMESKYIDAEKVIEEIKNLHSYSFNNIDEVFSLLNVETALLLDLSTYKDK